MPNELVTVAEFSKTWEAQLARNFLVSEHGIRAFIADEHCSGLEGLGVMVSAKLQVAKEDATRAQALLAD